ncbi:thiazole biosynthesis family protein [Kocuria salsicia]|uniref:thiazole biosynthesis family protein n=1 Tax=Kocuria salsicia TaxID=664639 RepID=UPI0011A76723|nr:thiazole biosynthesis family protein [Kocuria salsicia]
MYELTVAGHRLGAFWHCFGTERHRASLETIIDLLQVSKTAVLPINTHRLDSRMDRDALEQGFSGVSYDQLASAYNVAPLTKMLNINLRTSADAAVEVAKLAFEMTQEPVLKLEVLTPDLRESSDDGVLEAAERLLEWNPELVVFPLLTSNPDSSRRAAAIGCPLVRVMGSAISSRKGIEDEDAFSEIVQIGLPVVLDGGIGSPEHIVRAAELGAQGVLVNSVLFDAAAGPVPTMATMRSAAEQVF